MNIFLILVFSFLLRLISLNQSFWLDESTSANLARDFSLSQIISNFSPADFHPPLYYLILNVWDSVFGSSEVSLRFPSILFGVGTVYLVYLITKKISNDRIALVASLLMAIAPLHVYYSQEARMYSQTAFFITLSVYLFLNQKWLYFGISLALAIFSDYLAIFMLPVFWIYRPKKFKLLSLTPLFFLSFLWSPIFMTQLKAGLGVENSSPEWWKLLGQASFKQFILVPVKFVVGRISFDSKIVYASIVSSGLLLSGIGVLKSYLSIKKLKLIFLWLILPLVLILATSLKVPILSYFRLLYLLPAFYILLAFGLETRKVLLAGMLVLTLFSTFLYLINPKYQREDWRGLVNFVNQNSRGKSAKTVFVANSQMEAYHYYSKYNMEVPAVTINEVEKSEGILWLMRYVQDIFDSKDQTRMKIEQFGYEKQEEYDFNGIVVWKYTK